MTASFASLTSAPGRVSQPAPVRADPCADPTPACPVCGGLTCLCRPRFFPGQLLSDGDLNRLQQYVIDKNRLHNRYLVGWGVACGLEVECNPCNASTITVRAGYALSPCGDDIVLCADQSVDICQLIQSCRPANPTVCDPPFVAPPTDCTEGVERWVLAVCYDERPTRGITALTGAGDSIAKAGCRCGGSAGCGCGGSSPGNVAVCSCGGSGGAGGCSCGARTKAYQPATGRRGLPQCEPTQVCEGFRFTVYKAPVAQKGLTGLTGSPAATSGDLMIAWLFANRARFGPLLERALCCVLTAMELRAMLREGRALDAADAAGNYRDYAHALRDLAAEFSLHHCTFVDGVRGQFEAAVEWSRSRLTGRLDPADRTELSARFEQLDRSWIQIATECFCSALLPACPPPANSNCVPLAVVTVNLGGPAAAGSRMGSELRCQVTDICNWQERKLLVTWPTIQYWLSWLPWARLREAIALICCGTGRQTPAYTLMTLMLGVAVAGARRATTPGATTATASGVAGATTPGAPATDTPAPAPPAPGSFEAAMQAPNLLVHMLGDFDNARAGAPTAPFWASLASRVFDGSAFAPLAGNAALHTVDLSDIGKQLGVEAMREQIAALQETVARQDEVLRALRVVRRQQGRSPPPPPGS